MVQTVVSVCSNPSDPDPISISPANNNNNDSSSGTMMMMMHPSSEEGESSSSSSSTTTTTTFSSRRPALLDDPWFLSEDAASELGDYDDFWEELDCDEVLADGKERPIHEQWTWMLLRGVYQGIVGPNYSTIDADRILENGFQVPVTVQQIPGKGRGIVALEDIPEGTLVWKGRHTARFPSPVEFRRFLATLPNDLACDVMIWAYVEDHDDYEDTTTTEDHDYDETTITDDNHHASIPPLFFLGTRSVITVDLDEGALINTRDTTTEKNIDNLSYTSNRLIKAGEELIVDYSDFEKSGSWAAVGFGSEEEDDELFYKY